MLMGATGDSTITLNTLWLRRLIGFAGFGLPVVMVVSGWAFDVDLQSSLSAFAGRSFKLRCRHGSVMTCAFDVAASRAHVGEVRRAQRAEIASGALADQFLIHYRIWTQSLYQHLRGLYNDGKI